MGEKAGDLRRRHRGQAKDLLALAIETGIRHARHQRHLQKPHHQPHQVRQREEPPQTLQRVQPRQVGGQFLRQEEKADLQEVRSDAREHQQPEDRQQVASQRVDQVLLVGDEELRVGREPGLAAQLLGCVASQHFDDRSAQP